MFRWMAYTMIIFFLYAVVMQYNDPDTWIWVGLYSLAGVCTAYVVIGNGRQRWPLFFQIVFATLLFSWTAWNAWSGASFNLTGEVYSELGGTSIVVLWAMILWRVYLSHVQTQT